MELALLDTDMLSEVLKQKNAEVVLRAAQYLEQHGQFALSAITRYEVLRGLLEKNAEVQLARFETFCSNSLILLVSESIFDRAAQLWVAGRRGGSPHRDADLLIAATALEHGRQLITGNRAHFVWIPELRLKDWREK